VNLWYALPHQISAGSASCHATGPDISNLTNFRIIFCCGYCMFFLTKF